MTIYENVKANVSMKQVAEHYGLKVSRNGMAYCPFHDDRHPSLKLNEDYFFCFGCGATGDVIDFVARLYGLGNYEAAQKIAADFGLNPKPPTKTRLERQMDTLDINDAHYDRKILDLQRRYDEQYDTIGEIETEIDELQSQIISIRQEKISGDNIYQLLLAFDEVYNSATEAEQKEFMKAFIERIDLFPEKQKDGNWIKNIVFNFPVPMDGGEVKELPLEYETTVEKVAVDGKVDYSIERNDGTFEVKNLNEGTNFKFSKSDISKIIIQKHIIVAKLNSRQVIDFPNIKEIQDLFE